MKSFTNLFILFFILIVLGVLYKRFEDKRIREEERKIIEERKKLKSRFCGFTYHMSIILGTG